MRKFLEEDTSKKFPLGYKIIDDLDNAINDYFVNCDIDKKPYSLYDLLVHLDWPMEEWSYWVQRTDKAGRAVKMALYRLLGQAETGGNGVPANLCIMTLANLGNWTRVDPRDAKQDIQITLTFGGKNDKDAGKYGE